MAIKYSYGLSTYDTEAEAQAAVLTIKSRLDNNPTDWVRVKEISGSNESGWLIPPEVLTDDQINNLDASKTYSIYSTVTGENLMPLTAAEISNKVIEYRKAYANWIRANVIIQFEDQALPSVISEITPTEDMSVYL